MLPVIAIGPLSVPTYPLALLLTAWVALEVGARVTRRHGLDGDHIYNAGLYAFLAGIVAARLGHVIAYWPAYRTQPLEILGLNTRAFLLWPGLAVALLILGVYCYRHRLPLPVLLDAGASAALAGAIGASLAALLDGRTPGAATTVPWAITLWGVSRHPSQLYEALAVLIVLGVVLRMQRAGARPGAAAWVALLGYGLSRWLLEPFRAESTTVPGGLRLAQVLGLAAALIALAGLRRLSLQARPEAGGS